MVELAFVCYISRCSNGSSRSKTVGKRKHGMRLCKHLKRELYDNPNGMCFKNSASVRGD